MDGFMELPFVVVWEQEVYQDAEGMVEGSGCLSDLSPEFSGFQRGRNR